MKKMTYTALALAAGLALVTPATAQQAPAKPAEGRLAKVFADDQLSIEKCGPPRNAADDYLPAAALPDQTRAPRIVTKAKYQVDILASGLNHPWALAFLPGGKMIVDIRSGGLRIIDKPGVDGTAKVSEPLAGAPAIKNSIRLFGMHDLITDRDFAKNRTIYLAYVNTPEGAKGPVGYIASARIAADEKSVTDWKVLKEGQMIPRRLIQAKDGKLMAMTADILTPYKLPQDVTSPQGKVLRINTDGSVPKDNPFFSTRDADPSVYALGLRDPQGMSLHPATGDLWITENEPRGGDELNLIRPGKNYGFPVISYGRDNDGKLLNNGKTQNEGMEQPIYYWTPSIAPSGLTFYTGTQFPEWKNNIFAGAMSGMQLVRLELSRDGRVIGEEKLLRDRCKRIRDVRQGPDGLLYVITDEDNGEVWRISPAK